MRFSYRGRRPFPARRNPPPAWAGSSSMEVAESVERPPPPSVACSWETRSREHTRQNRTVRSPGSCRTIPAPSRISAEHFLLMKPVCYSGRLILAALSTGSCRRFPIRARWPISRRNTNSQSSGAPHRCSPAKYRKRFPSKAQSMLPRMAAFR